MVGRLFCTLLVSMTSLLTLSGDTAVKPRFETYRAPVLRNQKPKLKLNTNDARLYRTRLRSGVKKGIRFGGHYAVAEWGCGTACTTMALIDQRSGTVHFSGIQGCNLEYYRDSRLLRVSSLFDCLSEGDGDDEYFVWNGKRFLVIQSRRGPRR